LLLVALVAVLLAGSRPAAAQTQQRFIVRANSLTSVLNFCLTANCQVVGPLDGSIGQTYLVTSSQNLLLNVVNGVVNLVASLLGIQSIEADVVLPLPQVPLNTIAGGLYDITPVNYYGTLTTHGYVYQPATSIIRLQDAQSGFNTAGKGIVAVIDTGVDTNHPVLVPVLLTGYDFTRNQQGASEWLDVPLLEGGSLITSDASSAQPGYVQQSSAAVLDQSSAAVLDGGPYSAFGHGTMTCGLVHLVAPKAKILPLKAFSSDGTGYLSNIVAAMYFAVQNHANVMSMSFSLSYNSPSLSHVVSYANKAGVVLVAASGNNGNSVPVYPAAISGYVIGIASTSNTDTLSSFSNYGTPDVWIAAPGENIVSTYPGGTYASDSGTSFSAPMVAGSVYHLLSAKQHSLNQSQAANALAHAQTLSSNLNHGRLDVYKAISAWLSTW